MDASFKKILRGISLELRHELEGWHDKKTGAWNAGDLERRLNEIGVWGDRPSKPLDEMPHLSSEDKAARRLVDGYLQLRAEAGVERAAAVAEFVRESAYTWANRLFALRCMEARSIIEEVVLQKAAYAGRSLVHQRHLRKNPDAANREDDGLFAVLFAEFAVRSQELPALFDPKSPAVALRPSVAALKRCVALLSGTETVRGQDPATDEVFAAPDAFGWAYQYWNADEKDRVFEMVRTKKDAKIQGADIIPATQLYTEPYMVKFLVQNSLGALWMGMYPDSKLWERWEYYVKDADRASVTHKPVREITFLDPAEGSGHFHLEAFDLFYAMYEEEGARECHTLTPREIAAAILNHNLYGIDIDGRSVQIATVALWMKAKERAPELESGDLTSFHEHLVATNIRLPKERNHLELFLQKHPEDKDLRPALELVFQGLENADQLGSLLQIEELVDAVLRRLKEDADKKKGTPVQAGLFEPTMVQGTLPVSVEDYDKWKRDALNRLQAHFETEAQAAEPVRAFFGDSAGKSLTFFNVLSRRYDVVAANPPYMGSRQMGLITKNHVKVHYPETLRDVCATFVRRAHSLLMPNGFAALVTQQSWLFSPSFSQFRHTEEEDGILDAARLNALVQLGEHAFDEGAAGAVVAMFIIQAARTEDDSVVTAISLVGATNSQHFSQLLRKALVGVDGDVNVFRPRQRELLKLPGAPVVFWITKEFSRLFALPRVDSISSPAQGLKTSDNPRFIRFGWEVLRCDRTRWTPFVKGEGFRRWTRGEFVCIDWQDDGQRLKTFTSALLGGQHWSRNITNTDKYFRPALVYTYVARGKLALRELTDRYVVDAGSPILTIAEEELRRGLLAYLNSRSACFLARLLSQNLFNMTGVRAMPLPQLNTSSLSRISAACISLKAQLDKSCVVHEDYVHQVTASRTLVAHAAAAIHEAHLASLEILLCEACIEHFVKNHLNLSDDALCEVFASVGTPVGYRKIISRKGALVRVAGIGERLPTEVMSFLGRKEVELFSDDALAALSTRLRIQFEAGFKATESESDAGDNEHQQEEDADVPELANVFLPPETHLEELSQELEVHPISIYWLLKEGIEREGWRCPPEERRLTEDRFTVLVLLVLGHRWPKQLETGEPFPAWADQDGVIPLTSDGGETPLIECVRDRLAEDFPGGNVTALEREFEEIVGVPLEQWLAGPFFDRHVSQFRKRPIAWHLETVASRQAAVPGGKGKKKRPVAGKPVFACLVYYHKLDVDLLPKIRTHYVGLLSGGFETELRTLECLANPTADQQARRLQLEQWTDELQTFDRMLEDVSLRGFGPEVLRPALRQYGINDALLSLTASWLRRLSETVAKGPMSDWTEAATKTDLHPDFPKWLRDSMSNLNHFCAVLGPKPPDEKSLATDPTSKELAPLVSRQARTMVEGSLKLGCDRWWRPLDAAVLEPLRQEIKTGKAEIETIDLELKTEGLPYQRRNELGERKHELKEKVKSLKADHDEKSDRARKVRSQIEKWTCPEAETWEAWLCAQPLFDAVTSLDSQRPPPQSIADFITQESRYAPDINDGVRVNIAPIQKAGLLHAEVLDVKDADKAIADRAEWRADERRWVREGKLPQPGWWKENL